MKRASVSANRARGGFDRDAGTVLVVLGPAVTENLAGKRADVDRLAEKSGETCLQQPIVISSVAHRAQRDDRNVRSPCTGAELAGNLGAGHVGETEVEQDHVREARR